MRGVVTFALAGALALWHRRGIKQAEDRARATLTKENETREKDFHYLDIVLEEAKAGVKAGEGGPFGAIIVQKDTGEIVAQAHNAVLSTNDPTAHAEMLVIQQACKKLNTMDLSGCEIFTSCEPCPMSFAAIFLARLSRLVYGASSESAVNIGFDANNISDAIRGTAVHQKSTVKVQQLNHPKFHNLFEQAKKDDQWTLY
ncbi:cytidine deaminase [Chloropicon primus]|uniref:Cytidine deaminase n=1 Tax=Chloropicon primus TaxID=1764295 RepID=A0A5B8MJA3_9CHLO|nr:cytidine deaminase [Chloropicon primus]UPQ98956.1 cytidine deaminase [Chloropicon primus]|eukprot:QDZ19745.1 cytidine deaminase [Chloropicon primus]